MKKITFAISPFPRSGTNYLGEIIKNLNKSYRYPEKFPEGQFLRYSDLIINYTEKTIDRHKKWIGEEKIVDNFKKELRKLIGAGINKFIEEKVDIKNEILIKYPLSIGIENVFDLFPDCKIIILTRDGRDAVASAIKTWGKNALDKTIRTYIMSKQWSENTRILLNFLKKNEYRKNSFIVVKYEDLINKKRKEITRIADFLKIDKDLIDWNAIENIGLIGSSIIKDINTKVHWKEVKKPENFNPIGKWQKWSLEKKLIFKYTAGKELIDMEYENNNSW